MTDESLSCFVCDALGIEAEILLLAKDCSGKPDPKGNAQIILNFLDCKIVIGVKEQRL